jgi:hypothetical protein
VDKEKENGESVLEAVNDAESLDQNKDSSEKMGERREQFKYYIYSYPEYI